MSADGARFIGNASVTLKLTHATDQSRNRYGAVQVQRIHQCQRFEGDAAGIGRAIGAV
eukprot:gene11938-15047_t